MRSHKLSPKAAYTEVQQIDDDLDGVLQYDHGRTGPYVPLTNPWVELSLYVPVLACPIYVSHETTRLPV